MYYLKETVECSCGDRKQINVYEWLKENNF